MAFLLNLFTISSSLPIIIGDIENRTTAVTVDQLTDGGLFLKRIIHGEKIADKPGYLLFTAPYKLCEGSCEDVYNFAMAFPLYVGKKGNEMYKNMYQKDYLKIHSTKSNAPFKKRTTKKPFTLCPRKETVKQITCIDKTIDFETIFTTTETSAMTPTTIMPEIICTTEIPTTTETTVSIAEEIPSEFTETSMTKTETETIQENIHLETDFESTTANNVQCPTRICIKKETKQPEITHPHTHTEEMTIDLDGDFSERHTLDSSSY